MEMKELAFRAKRLNSSIRKMIYVYKLYDIVESQALKLLLEESKIIENYLNEHALESSVQYYDFDNALRVLESLRKVTPFKGSTYYYQKRDGNTYRFDLDGINEANFSEKEKQSNYWHSVGEPIDEVFDLELFEGEK